MKFINADKLRERLKESDPTPYDTKFCAMINELAFEDDTLSFSDEVGQALRRDIEYIKDEIDSVHRELDKYNKELEILSDFYNKYFLREI